MEQARKQHLNLVAARPFGARPPSTPAEMSSLADDAKLLGLALLAVFVVSMIVSLVFSLQPVAS